LIATRTDREYLAEEWALGLIPGEIAALSTRPCAMDRDFWDAALPDTTDLVSGARPDQTRHDLNYHSEDFLLDTMA
jgi:hypothetical protein